MPIEGGLGADHQDEEHTLLQLSLIDNGQLQKRESYHLQKFQELKELVDGPTNHVLCSSKTGTTVRAVASAASWGKITFQK